MTRWSRTILIAAVALCALAIMVWVGLRFALPNHDQRTRKRILEQVAAEVPIGSNAGVMEAFLRKHAETGVTRFQWTPRRLGL